MQVMNRVGVTPQRLVAGLCFNSIPQRADTASASSTATSEPEDSGVHDNHPVLAQHAKQEALFSTENVLPRHGVLAWNPSVRLEKNRASELSLFGEPKCLS